MIRRLLLMLLCWAGAASAAPQLVVPDAQLGLAGGRVHPGLLLNLALTFVDAGAAYRDSYRRNVNYAGYFNPRLCYSYPMARRSASVMLPELDDATGHFTVQAEADAQHECTHAFSGNFLNWASMSTLDLLRLALTGGDRVIDEPGSTVLQRAWLPDGAFHPDFYASATHFPRKSVSAASKVTPFDAATLFVVSCRNRLLLSHTAKGRDCDAPRFGSGGRRLVSDKFFGEFNLRVKVCDGADRRPMCQPYAAGAKPEGAIQRHSAGLRIGIMSYLTGPGSADPNLYGGVLRAPLKFVGAQRFSSPDFTASANPHAEWQAATGVLIANPDRAAGEFSGAINYINLLGRAQADRRGAYKGAGPGAELFYESLRYMQGRAPSVSDGAASDAGFPVWNARADPVSASCQRTAIATIGHGGFADDRYLPGNTRAGKKDGPRPADSFSATPFDVMQATRKVGAFEADPTGVFGNRKRRPDLLALDGMDDGADGSFYLAGASYWAHTQAIRTDKPLRLDSYSLELGGAAHPASGALYLAAKYGAFCDRNDDGNPFISGAGRFDDSEWSVDGETPAGYFGAPDGADIAGAVHGLFSRAASPRAIVPGHSTMATRGGTSAFVIQSSYEQGVWSGRVERLNSRVGAKGALEIAAAPVWEAAKLLDAAPPSERRIFTTVYSPDGANTTVPFRWGSLPAAPRAALDPLHDGLGEARVAYLRGERSREGVFRRRADVLGDSIHGTPLVIGAPSASVQGAGYDAFHARYKARANAVYLGANDGMLHAFDAGTGSELFAYIPHALLPAVAQLSDPAYAHRPYVDATAGYGEATLDGRWTSVLVSGMGMGARGVFALDVSNPAAFASGRGALWEFTDADDPAMGHVRSAPLIVKLKVGTKGKLPVHRYFALVASGINNYAVDGNSDGALFLLALDKAASARWRLGVNYYRLAAPAADNGLANALAPPALAVNADASVRYAYAGDLQGRMWRFDLGAGPPFSASPLFEARDNAGQRQSIAHAPKVVFAPGGGYLVLFATGRLLETADLQPSAFAPQTMYAIHDSAATPAVAVRGRSQLAQRNLSGGASYAITGIEFDYGGATPVKGWYFDFANARGDGERAAGSPALAAGTLFVNTIVPGADPCAAPKSRTYVVDALTGFAFKPDGVAAGGATTGELTTGSGDATPLIFELFASVGPRNPTGGATATRSIGVLRWQGEGAAPLISLVKVSLPARRLSWREIANWRELHAAFKK